MPGPTADVDRETFDASKGDVEARFQQGQPVLASDLNALQQVLRWNITRGMDALAAYSTTVAPLGLRSLVAFGDRNTTLAWPPVLFAEVLTWAPGSMRPYVFDGNAVENDFSVMWGPCFFEGLFLDDVESRYPLVSYASTSHVITTGIVSSVVGTTITDSSKNFPDLDGAGRLHLVGELAGVGNGVDRPCRVRFTTGDAAGEEYEISAVPSSSSLTLTGPFVGAVAADDHYAILPNEVTFVAAQVETVWLCMWVEDVDSVEDPDLLEPTTGMEPSHRLRTRYWLRVLPDGANSPVSSARPLYTDAAPHAYEGRVFWAQVALITPTGTILAPANFDYTLPEDQEIVDSIAGLTASLSNDIASLASLTTLFDVDHHAASGNHEQITLSGASDLPVTCSSAIAQRVDLSNSGVGTLGLRSDGNIEAANFIGPVGTLASLLAGAADTDVHTIQGEWTHVFDGGGGGTALAIDGDTGRIGIGGTYGTRALKVTGSSEATVEAWAATTKANIFTYDSDDPGWPASITRVIQVPLELGREVGGAGDWSFVDFDPSDGLPVQSAGAHWVNVGDDGAGVINRLVFPVSLPFGARFVGLNLVWGITQEDAGVSQYIFEPVLDNATSPGSTRVLVVRRRASTGGVYKAYNTISTNAPWQVFAPLPAVYRADVLSTTDPSGADEIAVDDDGAYTYYVVLHSTKDPSARTYPDLRIYAIGLRVALVEVS